jgi:hypothetical protein
MASRSLVIAAFRVMEAAAYPQRGVTTMKARLKPTHIIDHDLLERALKVAEAQKR